MLAYIKCSSSSWYLLDRQRSWQQQQQQTPSFDEPVEATTECLACVMQHLRNNTLPPHTFNWRLMSSFNVPIVCYVISSCIHYSYLSISKRDSVTSHHKYACAVLVFGIFPMVVVTVSPLYTV
jgi:hypothetical protein